jgi:hypothetical protein
LLTRSHDGGTPRRCHARFLLAQDCDDLLFRKPALTHHIRLLFGSTDSSSVEHYEITRYGTLIAWAEQLGRKDCASLLQQNLDEEKATDTKLNALALRNVNQKAA